MGDSRLRDTLVKMYEFIPYLTKKNTIVPKILSTYKTKRYKADSFHSYYYAPRFGEFLHMLNAASLFLPSELLTYDKNKEIELLQAIRMKQYINLSFLDIRIILTEIFLQERDLGGSIPRAVYNDIFLNCLKQLKYLEENQKIDYQSYQKHDISFEIKEFCGDITVDDLITTQLIAQKLPHFNEDFRFLKIAEDKYFSRIAGTFFHYFRDDFMTGMSAELVLKRETENVQDKNAVGVFSKEEIRLGYLPKEFAEIIAPIMDANQTVSAYIADFDLHPLDAVIIVEIVRRNNG